MNKKIQIILSLLVIFGMILIPYGETSAQQDPLLVFFNPDPAYLYTSPSNTTVIDIDITNAVDIWSYSIVVDYDESIAVLQSYEVQDIFNNIACQYQVNDPGHFGLGCVSWGGVPFNGDTTVVKLTFVGVSTGQTPLTFDTLTNFSNTSFNQVPIDRQHGELNVVDPSSFIYLPLIMNVSVQGVLERDGIEVGLAGLNYGMSYSETSADIEGYNLDFGEIVADTYRITTNHARVLNVTPALNKTFTLSSGASEVPLLRLAAGNAVWTDNVIDVHDWTAVNGAWGDASLNEDADVNFDGAVDGRDLALVGGNFGLTSAMAYVGWLP